MACGGFRCSKNALIALNMLYILVAFILVGVSTYGRTANIVTNVPIIGGIIACGVFLFIIAVLGIIGAAYHHQVVLFFYMVILFLLFVVQFGLACSCLAITKEQQKSLAEIGWEKADNDMKQKAQEYFSCCGFTNSTTSISSSSSLLNATISMKHPSCSKIPKCCPTQDANCCTDNPGSKCGCDPCYAKLQDAITEGLRISGGIGLFFSFTEFIGVWLTVRYRNQKDPRSNPREFI